MGVKLRLSLEGEGGVIRAESFTGEHQHDLAMLGAAKGFLEGLYKHAEGPAMFAGMAGPLGELYREINKPTPWPP